MRLASTDAPGRGHILLLHGRTEFLEKYAEIAPALARRGFAVASLDWRGQGASARLAPDPRMGHVDDFASYQTDLAALLQAPEIRTLPGPRIVLAHSMGGCVALRALSSGLLSDGVAGAIFSAPMWGLSGAAGRFGPLLAGAACALGFAERYVVGAGPTPYALQAFNGNVLTSDPDQHARLGELARRHPDYGLGGPSWLWLRSAIRETRALRKVRLTTPGLVLIGSEEQVVSPADIRERAARDRLDLLEIMGGRHELLFETPQRRAETWRAIDSFLSVHAPVGLEEGDDHASAVSDPAERCR